MEGPTKIMIKKIIKFIIVKNQVRKLKKQLKNPKPFIY
jgi:hypothetical protein